MKSRVAWVRTFSVLNLLAASLSGNAGMTPRQPEATPSAVRIAQADENKQKSEAAQEKTASKRELNVRQTFASICGFCHEDYGRKAGKGPQLMDNPNSDEFLFNRIKNGKPGRMAAFGGAFSDDEIRAMVAFMRKLKPNEDPR